MFLLALLLGCVDHSDAAFKDHWPAVAKESAICFSVSLGDVVAIGMDSGTIAPLIKVPQGSYGLVGTTSLARLNENIYWCGGREGLGRLDMLTGEVERSGHTCKSVADIDGGLMLMQTGSMTWYESWDAVLAEEGTAIQVDHHGSRLGRFDGDIITAWHSTREIQRFDATSGNLVDEIKLKRFDTWVNGLSGVGSRLFVLNDGRDDFSVRPAWNPRIGEFDSRGRAVFNLFIGDQVRAWGLSCSGPVDPATFSI